MASRLTDRLARRLRSVPANLEPGTDADLLRRFTQHRDEAAFADLVHRHGPAVLAVCQRALGDTPDAEDAFQATFLVLARRAEAVHRGGSVGCWLYGVALRVARKARRRPPPPIAAERPGPPDPAHEAAWRELAEVLDEELARLPDRLRDPLVLCYFHGHTRDEAAAELGWSLSTLKRRLDRAREILRARLTGRGIAPPIGLLGAVGLVWGPPAAAVPAPLRLATLGAVTGKALGGGGAADRLADAVVAGTNLVRMKLAVGALLVIAVVAAGVGLADGPIAPPEVTQPTPLAKTEPPAGVAATPAAPPVDPLRPGAVARLGGGALRAPNPFSGRLAFPADGRTMFGVSDEWGVTQWDLHTGQVLRRLTDFGTLVLGDAAVSADGKLLAVVVGRPNGIAFWDVEREVVLWRTTPMRDAGTWRPSLSLSPDGRVLAVWGVDDQNISLWDTTQRKVYATLSGGRTNSAVFTPDSKTLITRSLGEAAIRVWDVATGAVRMSLAGAAGRTSALAVSPDGKMLASAEAAGLRIDLWDLTTGRKLRAFEGGVDSASLAFSPNGQQLFASNLQQMVVWGVGTGKVERQVEMAGAGPIIARGGPNRGALSGGPNRSALSPDGRSLTVKKAAVIQVYETETGKERFPVTGHQGTVHHLAFSPDGRLLGSVGNRAESGLRFWDAQTGRVVEPYPKPVECFGTFAWSSDGRVLASANAKGIFIHDARTGAELRHLDRPLASQTEPVAFIGIGNKLVLGDHGGTVSIWDWAGKEAPAPLGLGEQNLTAVAASADGRWVAIAPIHESSIQLWDVATGKRVHTLGPTDKGRASGLALAFSPNGQSIAVSFGNTTYVYNIADGKAVRTFQDAVTGWINGVAFSPDGAHLATVSHEGPAYIKPDGRKVGSADHPQLGYVRVWEVATGRLVRRFRDPGNRVECLAYAPDGKRIATAGTDGVITVWDVSAPTPLAPLPEEIPFRLREEKQPAPVTIPPEKLVRLWDALGGSDVRAGLRAADELVATGNQAVTFLATRVKPVPAPDAAKLAKLVTELGDDRFATREQATAELAKMGELATAALRARLKDNPSAEVGFRVKYLLDRLHPDLPTGDRLRELVAIRILQRIKTPEAKRVLTDLAAGAEGARLTQEAKQANAPKPADDEE